ncbi:MAG: hypothetical protein WEB00_15635, partial [Dehalococcoidia bacterium]
GATTGNQAAPVAVSGLSGVRAIAAGFIHSLALVSNGTVMSWGSDGAGQLGNGATTGVQAAPVAVSGLSGVAAVAGGGYHSLAIRATCLGRLATRAGSAAGETIAGTPGVDVIHGGGGTDIIDGLGGDDIICGGDGDDTITGNAGDDEIDGGKGRDTALFPGPAVNVNLAVGTALAGIDGDTLTSIENASGSSSADTLIGDGAGNRLEGLGGADTCRAAPAKTPCWAGRGRTRSKAGRPPTTLAVAVTSTRSATPAGRR